MPRYFALVFLTISIVIYQGNGKSILNGKHLRCIPREIPTAITIGGPQIELLKALSKMYNFSYSFMYIDTPRLEDSPTARGALSYLVYNEADCILSSAVGTESRFKLVDFPASFYEGSLSALVPYPREKLDITASLKPFPYEAWILIIATASSTLFCIDLFHGNLHCKFCRRNLKSIKQKKRQNAKKSKTLGFNFVLGNLVSQGQSCQSPALTVRIVAGTWCVGCFFLVQIYCSTLTSYLTSPNQKPIASTVQELVNYPGLKLTVDRGLAAELLMLNATYGSLKRMGDNLRSHPKSRCNKTDDCLSMVRNDGATAYSAPISSLQLIMGDDSKTSSTCHYYMIKETFATSSVFTFLQKNSPYTETMSRGILRIKHAGLYNEWVSWIAPQPIKCVRIYKKNNKPNLRISLAHLSSAFVIFFTGTVSSILALLFEILVKYIASDIATERRLPLSS